MFSFLKHFTYENFNLVENLTVICNKKKFFHMLAFIERNTQIFCRYYIIILYNVQVLGLFANVTSRYYISFWDSSDCPQGNYRLRQNHLNLKQILLLSTVPYYVRQFWQSRRYRYMDQLLHTITMKIIIINNNIIFSCIIEAVTTCQLLFIIYYCYSCILMIMISTIVWG